jgi:beta-mannosidase
MPSPLSRMELSEGWSFRQGGDKSEMAWLPVRTVPTDVYRDLLANEKIADPFKDLNELSVRWVADKDWEYRTRFDAPQWPINPGVQIDIVFQGLDTFATVNLNGTEVLKSDNMFLSHRVNVTKHLESSNVLEIVFKSARIRGQELLKEHSHEHRFIARQTEDGRIPVRKAQYHWGWDWGPIMSGTSGPWRPVYLEHYTSRINDVWAQSDVSGDLQRSRGTLFAAVDGSKAGDIVIISLSFDGQTAFENECSIGADGLAECHFEVTSPRLWYPRGYGGQDYYQIKAVLMRDGQVLHEQEKTIGFRTVELVQEPDSYGKSFYFRINGVDVFAGGSCWIPGSSYLSALSGQDYHDWIKLLAEGNQTMVRVWGGEYPLLYLDIQVWNSQTC